MPTAKHYLNSTGAGELAGIHPGQVRKLHKLGKFPAPDIWIGKAPGWRPATVTKWATDRTRKDARTAPETRFLDRNEVASIVTEATGVPIKGVGISQRHTRRTFPPADASIADRVYGWRRETVEQWLSSEDGKESVTYGRIHIRPAA